MVSVHRSGCYSGSRTAALAPKSRARRRVQRVRGRGGRGRERRAPHAGRVRGAAADPRALHAGAPSPVGGGGDFRPAFAGYDVLLTEREAGAVAGGYFRAGGGGGGAQGGGPALESAPLSLRAAGGEAFHDAPRPYACRL